MNSLAPQYSLYIYTIIALVFSCETFVALAKYKLISSYLVKFKEKVGIGMSYVIIGSIGAVLAISYWWGIQRIFTKQNSTVEITKKSFSTVGTPQVPPIETPKESTVRIPEKKESEQQIAAIQSLTHEIDVNEQMINTAVGLAKRWPTRSEKENFSYASYHELPIATVVATGTLDPKSTRDREMLENLNSYQQAINEFNAKLRIVGRHNPGIFIKADLIHVKEPKQWPSRIEEVLAEPFQNLLHAHKTVWDLLRTRYPNAEPTEQKKTSQTLLENIEKMIEYEYAPKFQIEDENISYSNIAGKRKTYSEKDKWSSRWFSYDAILHNVGTRVLNVSAVYLCALKPDEKDCPRSFHVASEFLLEPGGKRPFAFDTSQWAVSGLISELDNVGLFLQIEYINPDRSVSVFTRRIGGFQGEVPVMHMDIKAPKQG